jgi:hypothetical protein
MSLVIGVFQPADDRGGRADTFSELHLGRSRALSEVGYPARNRVVRFDPGQVGHSLRTPLIVAAMNDFDRVSRGGLLTHVFYSSHRLSARPCRLMLHHRVLSALEREFQGLANVALVRDTAAAAVSANGAQQFVGDSQVH